MKLVEILSAAQLHRPGWYDLQVVIDFEDGSLPVAHSFRFDPGDVYGLSLQVRAALPLWLASNEASPPVSDPEVDLLEYSAARRYDLETAGVLVGSSVIASDRQSQAMITGAYSFAQANPTATIKFKATDGWITANCSLITAVATAVGAHVQACFAAESSVASQIDSGAITSAGEVDAAYATAGVGVYFVDRSPFSYGFSRGTTDGSSTWDSGGAGGGTSGALASGSSFLDSGGESAGTSTASGCGHLEESVGVASGSSAADGESA